MSLRCTHMHKCHLTLNYVVGYVCVYGHLFSPWRSTTYIRSWLLFDKVCIYCGQTKHHALPHTPAHTHTPVPPLIRKTLSCVSNGLAFDMQWRLIPSCVPLSADIAVIRPRTGTHTHTVVFEQESNHLTRPVVLILICLHHTLWIVYRGTHFPHLWCK